MTTLDADIDVADNLLDEDSPGDRDDSADEPISIEEYSITSYGADLNVEGLVNRLQRGDIYTPPFQRGFVWSQRQSSRFLESLLLGLPVPGIFLYQEDDTYRLTVIDGQQRLTTLRYFYDGAFGNSSNAFALNGIDSRFLGITYQTLLSRDRRRLDDTIIHATIVRQDRPVGDRSSTYQIFERLNTGGIRLQPQEIRGAIYQGAFNNLLRDLNDNDNWRITFGSVHRRMRDQELILRFLAMYFCREQYRSPMKAFLNRYMMANRKLEQQSEHDIRTIFETTLATIYENLGHRAFKPNGPFHAALFESVAVGVASRLKRGDIKDGETLNERYQSLLSNDEYNRAIATGTSSASSVQARLSIAIEAFDDVQ